MANKGDERKQTANLRNRAEAVLRKKAPPIPESADGLPVEGRNPIFHNLQVIQIELQMQNEELRQREMELDASLARYLDLYDQAPVGYCTLSEQGVILEANLTVAGLIGTGRERLMKQPITRFIHRDDQDIYYLLLRRIHVTAPSTSCELRMVRQDGTLFSAHLDVTAAMGPDGHLVHRVALTDVSDRKQLEAYRDMGREVLQILNAPGDLHGAIQQVVDSIRDRTGFDAVGIRLQAGADYPYYAQAGFSKEFQETENALLHWNTEGKVGRGNDGNVCLECSCGLVITTKPGQSVSPLTPRGSFWTNDSSKLLSLPSDQDSRLCPRNTCTQQGYASMALIPIRDKGRNIGLLQLNDRRQDRFTMDIIELLESTALHLGEAVTRTISETALRESNELLTHFIAQSPIHAYINEVTPEESRIVQASDNFQRMIGPSGSEVVGKTVAELFPAEIAEKMASEDWAVVSSGKGLESEQEIHGRIYSTLKFPIIQREKMLVAGFNIDITERGRSERLLAASHEQLRTLLAQLRQAQEDERVRISREIHDELGQLLTGLKMDVRWLERKLSEPGLPPSLNPLLDRVVGTNDLADAMLATVQRIAAELRPSTLDTLGLEASISLEARRFQERSGVRCMVAPAEGFPVLPLDIASDLFYILREALTNVGRHAHAAHVEINWRIEGETVVFIVRDDGVGMVETEVGTRQSLGLTGMRERAIQCGGSITFEQNTPRGTRVTVHIPCKSPVVEGSESQ